MDGTLLFRAGGVVHIATGSALAALAIWLCQKGLIALSVGFAVVAIVNIAFGCWALRRRPPKNPQD